MVIRYVLGAPAPVGYGGDVASVWRQCLRFRERGPMKLKHLAALLMLFALGCAQQPAGESTAPPAESASTEPADTSTVDPATETQLASSTVGFNVTGMT